MATANFPIVTLTTWSGRFDDDSTGDPLLAQADVMFNEGKTDNVLDQTFDPALDQPVGPGSTGRLRYSRRYWVDVDAANQWITFVNSLSLPNLISIVIENQP